MLERYGGRDDIAGWQIDNEFGCHETTLSYDTSTLQRFRSWLGDHYESIEGLNDAWSTVFWSQEYPGFDAIGFPQKGVFAANEATTSSCKTTASYGA